MVRSYMWALVSQAGGSEKASAFVKGLAEKMSAEDIAEAEGLARAWLKEHPAQKP